MTEQTPAPTRAPVRVLRPTTKAEWTLILVLVLLGVFALCFTAALALKTWPARDAHDLIHYLGWGLFLSIGGMLLVVAALASPYVGTVRASGLGAEVELRGRGEG